MLKNLTTLPYIGPADRADRTAFVLAPGAQWILNRGPHRLGGLIHGRVGAGQSDLLHDLAAAALAAGLETAVIDPIAPGRASRTIATHNAAHPKAAASLLSEIDAILSHRIEHGGTTPLLVCVDNADYVLDDHRNLNPIHRLARLGSPLGIALILAGTTFPSLDTRLFTDGNTVVFTYPDRGETAHRLGTVPSKITVAPAHLRGPDGTVTGFRLD